MPKRNVKMNKAFSRTDRLSQTIQKELARLLLTEYQDPRAEGVTVLSVSLAPDLAYAKVYVSVLDEKRAPEVLSLLNKTSGFFRSHLANVMTARITPQLRFIYDDSILKGQRMEAILKTALGSSDENHET